MLLIYAITERVKDLLIRKPEIVWSTFILIYVCDVYVHHVPEV